MKPLRAFAVLGIIVAVGLVAARLRGGPVARPPAFAGTLTLAEAIEEGTKKGLPVVAFATADWCPPCRAMKRETLLDPRVEAFLQLKTVPVYVNIDHDPAAAQRLNVMGIPATVVIRGSTIVAKTEGYLTAVNYLSFLESAVDLANSPEELEKLKSRPR